MPHEIRRIPIRATLAVGFAAMGSMAGTCVVRGDDVRQTIIALVFVSCFAAVTSMSISLPRGGEIRLDGGVAIASVALLSPTTALIASALGTLIGSVAHPFPTHRRQRTLSSIARHALPLPMFAWLFGQLAPTSRWIDHSATAAALLLTGVAYLLWDSFAFWVLTDVRKVRRSVPMSVSVTLVVYVAYFGIICLGVALALLFPYLGVLGAAVMVTLMLLIGDALDMLLKMKAAYVKTVLALSHMSELQRPGRSGHGERVSAIATAIGQQMRLERDSVARLAFAALLHGVGIVTGDDFDPSINAPDGPLERIGTAGAHLVTQIRALSDLAPILAQMHIDYQDYLGVDDPDGLLARIVRLASDFDDLQRPPSGEGLTAAAALDHLEAKVGSTYDPRAFNCLRAAVAAGRVNGVS